MHARTHTQAGLLTAAFYFVYHTTSPLLVDWASDGKEKQLAFEFDFAYFYSSMLAVVAIGLMFASTGNFSTHTHARTHTRTHTQPTHTHFTTRTHTILCNIGCYTRVCVCGGSRVHVCVYR